MDGGEGITYSYRRNEIDQGGEPSIGKAFNAMFSLYFRACLRNMNVDAD